MKYTLNILSIATTLTLSLTSCSHNLGYWETPTDFKAYTGRNLGSFQGPHQTPIAFYNGKYEATAGVVYETKDSIIESSFYELRICKKLQAEDTWKSDNLKIPLTYLNQEILKTPNRELIAIDTNKKIVTFTLKDKTFRFKLK